MTDPSTSLDEALAHLRAGAVREGLDALLACWRATRSPEIAARIDQLDALIWPCFEPIAGAKPRDRHAEWIRRATSATGHLQIGRLGEHVKARPLTLARERLSWIESQAPDPRWTRHLVDYPDRGEPGGWDLVTRKQLFGYFERLGDVRALHWLTARRLTRAGQRLERLRLTLEYTVTVQDPPAARLRALDDAIVHLTPPTRASLTATLDAPAEQRYRGLVYAHPADPGARQAYADWLRQADDPRAAFMALQQRARATLTRAEKAREAELLALHGTQWMGDLARLAKDVTWADGFPSGATFKLRGKHKRADALGSPAWRTITELCTTEADALAHPNCAQVRRLGRASSIFETDWLIEPVKLRAVQGAPPEAAARIEQVVLDYREVDAFDPRTLPGLTAIEVKFAMGHWRDLPRAVLHAPNITRVALWTPFQGWLPQLDARRFACIELRQRWGWQCRATPTAAGWALDLLWPWQDAPAGFLLAEAAVRWLAPAHVYLHDLSGVISADRAARLAAMIPTGAVHLPGAEGWADGVHPLLRSSDAPSP